MTTHNALFNSELPAIIDFWAPWCGPCRTTKPVLEKLADEYASQVEFKTINADEQPDLVREHKIFGIPTLLVVQNGTIVRRITGAQNQEFYRRLFEQLASGELTAASGPSPMDRLLRLAAGATLTILALIYSIAWLLPLGLVILFTGVYDRCPVWQAIRTRFTRGK